MSNRERAFERARELVLRHGWNSTCFQIVNPGIERWFTDDDNAVVGFVRSSGYRVVVGSPVCEETRLAAVVKAFEAEAEREDESVCYFAAETRLESLLGGDKEHNKFPLGAQPSWHPQNWAGNVTRHKSLRAQLNRARNK
ncbi:MAG: DUF2156 domain-containing protein, partial [Acidobacteria bacterium]|nr:DUF2156 domain-containing protein [Acidobacteriota bacterium]